MFSVMCSQCSPPGYILLQSTLRCGHRAKAAATALLQIWWTPGRRCVTTKGIWTVGQDSRKSPLLKSSFKPVIIKFLSSPLLYSTLKDKPMLKLLKLYAVSPGFLNQTLYSYDACLVTTRCKNVKKKCKKMSWCIKNNSISVITI